MTKYLKFPFKIKKTELVLNSVAIIRLEKKQRVL